MGNVLKLLLMRLLRRDVARQFDELAAYLFRELSFPHGALLMTGTGIVPGDGFTLQSGDEVRITVGDVALTNRVE